MNNFNCFLSEPLKVTLFFVAPGLPFVKNITDYSDRDFGCQSSQFLYYKFLLTPLYEPNCLKQNTKLF